MARYKVGDKVRVIDNFVLHGNYYMRNQNNDPGLYVTIKHTLNERMQLAGKIVTISEVEIYYRIEEDATCKYWSDDMFVGAVNRLTCRSLL